MCYAVWLRAECFIAIIPNRIHRSDQNLHTPSAHERQYDDHESGTSRRRLMVTAVGRIEDVAVSGLRIQSELGFQPGFKLEAGWRQALASRQTLRTPEVSMNAR